MATAQLKQRLREELRSSIVPPKHFEEIEALTKKRAQTPAPTLSHGKREKKEERVEKRLEKKGKGKKEMDEQETQKMEEEEEDEEEIQQTQELFEETFEGGDINANDEPLEKDACKASDVSYLNGYVLYRIYFSCFIITF